MHYRLLTVAILAMTIVASGVRADDVPVRQAVRGELEAQPEYFLNSKTGKPETRWKIDSVVATTPAKISAAIKDWTGIGDRGKSITVKFLPISRDDFSVSSYGDGYSIFASATPPGEEESVEVDTHVRYKESKIEGEIPKRKEPEDPIIHPTGTATWVGPIINASTPLFSDAAADEKPK